ncbi:MAG: tRNA (adenosine(37)-N6)-threonylcarbamoyltransferase complex dimerization subunit type 1 TsaB [candidate division WOR-3 bacterium]
MTLGIETSGEVTGLALVKEGAVQARLIRRSSACHNEVMFAMLDELFAGCQCARSDLGGVGVSLGPGMFTSLRVGLSVAKALAQVLGIPLKGVGTTEALVRTARDACGSDSAGPEFCLPLIDARQGEVYARLYQGQLPRTELRLLSLAGVKALIGELSDSSVLLVGSGACRYRAQIEAGLTPGSVDCRVSFGEVVHPSPEAVGLMAEEAIAQEFHDDIQTIVPVYLRPTDAEQRSGRPR